MEVVTRITRRRRDRLRDRGRDRHPRLRRTPDPSVQVKRVSVSFGATPLGRRPRRTKRVGTWAPIATASRAWPMPSVRQRSERPTTSRRASRAASRTPASPARTRTGSVTIPTTCCTSIEARDKSRLASRRPSSGIRLGSEEPERRPERLGEPGGHLDRGPVVLDASERRHDRPGGHLSSPDEHGDIAGCAFEDSREILVGMAASRSPGAASRRMRSTSCSVASRTASAAWLARGVGGYAGCDALLRERVSAFGERGARGRELTVVAQEPSQDELARRPSGERLGDREEVVEPLRVGRDDHDRSLSRRRGRLLRGQGRVMAKDRLLELAAGPGSARCRARRRAAAASRDRPRAPRPGDPSRRALA